VFAYSGILSFHWFVSYFPRKSENQNNSFFCCNTFSAEIHNFLPCCWGLFFANESTHWKRRGMWGTCGRGIW